MKKQAKALRQSAGSSLDQLLERSERIKTARADRPYVVLPRPFSVAQTKFLENGEILVPCPPFFEGETWSFGRYYPPFAGENGTIT
jgi:hypothetical protein